MLILSRVCAEFHDAKGNVLYRVTPDTRLAFREAPDAIREDPLFRMLLSDGSLEATVAPERQKTLEAEPLKGTDVAGKKLRSSSGAKRGTGSSAPAEQGEPSAVKAE